MSQPAALVGYLSEAYGASLTAFGEPRRLPRSSAWVLTRPIEGTPLLHARVGYRRTHCLDWDGLAEDLSDMGGVVSVVGVSDPFMRATAEQFSRAFPDHLEQYKDHFVVHTVLHRSLPQGHRYRLRQASRSVTVELESQPVQRLDDWMTLVRVLADRHGMSGPEAESRSYYHDQLIAPGAVAFLAMQGRECVAMTVWYVMGSAAYYHLAASTRAGYDVSATYALVAEAISWLAGSRIEWIDLGSNAGPFGQSDGLADFKRGWSTGTQGTLLGGRIVDKISYRDLVEASRSEETLTFPSYLSRPVVGRNPWT